MKMMSEKIRDAIDNLRLAMTEEGIAPQKGLGEDLFVFLSSLVPVVYVDLFITNVNVELLLVWRDDKYSDKGWHIPGGCVRLKEPLEERIIRTAKSEVGTEVLFDIEPIAVRQDISHEDQYWLENQLERSHNISFLYNYRLPERSATNENDQIIWFDSVPEKLLQQHWMLYGDIVSNYFEEKKKK